MTSLLWRKCISNYRLQLLVGTTDPIKHCTIQLQHYYKLCSFLQPTLQYCNFIQTYVVHFPHCINSEENYQTEKVLMGSYLVPAVGLGKVAQVSQADPDPQGRVIVAVKTQQDAMLEMMSQLVQRMGWLESVGQPGKGQGTEHQGIHSRGSATPRSSGTVVCYNCGQVAQFRCECAAPKKQGNGKPLA